jgi:hypothetical protein
MTLLSIVLLIAVYICGAADGKAEGTETGSTVQANRLFEDLLSDYNKLVRPVANNSEKMDVFFKLKLSQLIDVVCSLFQEFFRHLRFFFANLFSGLMSGDKGKHLCVLLYSN